MKKLIRAFILLVVLLVQATAATATTSVTQDQWRAMENSVLVEKASKFLGQPGSEDSAMLYLNILANRHLSESGNSETGKQSAWAKINLGYLYASRYYDYKSAYNYLQDAQDLLEKYGDKQNLAYVYNNMGCLISIENRLKTTSTPQQAIDYFKKAASVSEELKKWKILALNYCNLMELIFESQQPVSAVDAQRRQLQLLANTDYAAMGQYAQRYTDGCEAYERGDYSKAAQVFQAAAAIAEANGKGNPDFERICIMAYSSLIQVSAMLHDREGISRNTRLALQLAQKSGSPDQLVTIYRYAANGYREIGDTVAARDYDFQYLQSKDELINNSQLLSVEQQRFLRELDKANNQVKDLQVKRRELTYMLTAAAIFTLVVVAFVLLLWRSNKRLKEKNRILYQNSLDSLEREAQEQRERSQFEQRLRALETTVGTSGDGASQEQPHAELGVKYAGSSLSEEEKEQLLQKVADVMGNMEYITSPDFSLDRLADLVGANYKRVSQVINEKYGRNFNQLLAECRVKESCRRFNDPEHYGNLSIEGVAMEVGFKSRSNFTSNFKAIIGLSPSQYRAMAIKRQ